MHKSLALKPGAVEAIADLPTTSAATAATGANVATASTTTTAGGHFGRSGHRCAAPTIGATTETVGGGAQTNRQPSQGYGKRAQDHRRAAQTDRSQTQGYRGEGEENGRFRCAVTQTKGANGSVGEISADTGRRCCGSRGA